MSKIADIIGVSRNLVPEYFSYFERAGLIMQLRTSTKGIRALGKINKVYLNNPNLSYSILGIHTNIGNIRETFLLNQLRMITQVYSAIKGDFTFDDKVFEVGGKGKTEKQINDDANSYIIKDEIEHGFGNVVPLWHFGLMY